MALAGAGYHTLGADDGSTGLELAQAHLPDLILCDINLPSLNGWDLLEKIRANTGTAGVQFVFMTGHTWVNKPRVGMERGADDFLEKPFGLEALVSCVRARLQRAALSEKVSDGVVAELKSSLRSNLPHEFFTPLVGILGLADILRDEWQQLDPVEVTRYLGDIRRSGQRLHRTLRNYLFALDLQAAATPENGSMRLGPAEFASLVAEIAALVARRHRREADLTVSVAEFGACIAVADAELIVEELLENAFAFSSPGSPVEITLAGEGVLSINDRGRGMEAGQLEQIGAFRQFDRKQYEQQGLGLGLFLVSGIARRNSLVFDITSEPGVGTQATLTFPTN